MLYAVRAGHAATVAALLEHATPDDAFGPATTHTHSYTQMHIHTHRCLHRGR
jgi:hypothetical protein